MCQKSRSSGSLTIHLTFQVMTASSPSQRGSCFSPMCGLKLSYQDESDTSSLTQAWRNDQNHRLTSQAVAILPCRRCSVVKFYAWVN